MEIAPPPGRGLGRAHAVVARQRGGRRSPRTELAWGAICARRERRAAARHVPRSQGNQRERNAANTEMHGTCITLVRPFTNVIALIRNVSISSTGSLPSSRAACRGAPMPRPPAGMGSPMLAAPNLRRGSSRLQAEVGAADRGRSLGQQHRGVRSRCRSRSRARLLHRPRSRSSARAPLPEIPPRRRARTSNRPKLVHAADAMGTACASSLTGPQAAGSSRGDAPSARRMRSQDQRVGGGERELRRCVVAARALVVNVGRTSDSTVIAISAARPERALDAERLLAMLPGRRPADRCRPRRCR